MHRAVSMATAAVVDAVDTVNEAGSTTLAAATAAAAAPAATAEDVLPSIDEAVALLCSIGEEVVKRKELTTLLTTRRAAGQPIRAYDGFEPSGRMHIAQGILKVINVNKMTTSGVDVIFWVADWFAMLNKKLGGDLARIRSVGRYMIEVWTALGMDMSRVSFRWASEEVTARGAEYWALVRDVLQVNTLGRMLTCTQIMGRSDTDALAASQIMYPAMQCADIFFLGADICQLGMDQRKVNMLAREYCDRQDVAYEKPVVISHHMMMGLLEGQAKMSKSNPMSAIFMEDDRATIEAKLMAAFCPAKVVQDNPCLDYLKHMVFLLRDTLSFDTVTVGADQAGGEQASDHGTEATTVESTPEKKTYTSYEAFEVDYVAGLITPEAVKAVLLKVIDATIAPVRVHFASTPELQQLLQEAQTAAGAGKKDKKDSKKKKENKDAADGDDEPKKKKANKAKKTKKTKAAATAAAESARREDHLAVLEAHRVKTAKTSKRAKAGIGMVPAYEKRKAPVDLRGCVGTRWSYEAAFGVTDKTRVAFVSTPAGGWKKMVVKTSCPLGMSRVDACRKLFATDVKGRLGSGRGRQDRLNKTLPLVRPVVVPSGLSSYGLIVKALSLLVTSVKDSGHVANVERGVRVLMGAAQQVVQNRDGNAVTTSITERQTVALTRKVCLSLFTRPKAPRAQGAKATKAKGKKGDGQGKAAKAKSEGDGNSVPQKKKGEKQQQDAKKTGAKKTDAKKGDVKQGAKDGEAGSGAKKVQKNKGAAKPRATPKFQVQQVPLVLSNDGHALKEACEKYATACEADVLRAAARGECPVHGEVDEWLKTVASGLPAYVLHSCAVTGEDLCMADVVSLKVVLELQQKYDVPVVIQLRDDAFLRAHRECLPSMVATSAFGALKTGKQVAALGFDPKKTFMFMNSLYIKTFYRELLAIERSITVQDVEAAQGEEFDGGVCIGTVSEPALRLAPMMAGGVPWLRVEYARYVNAALAEQDAAKAAGKDGEVDGTATAEGAAATASDGTSSQVGHNKAAVKQAYGVEWWSAHCLVVQDMRDEAIIKLAALCSKRLAGSATWRGNVSCLLVKPFPVLVDKTHESDASATIHLTDGQKLVKAPTRILGMSDKVNRSMSGGHELKDEQEAKGADLSVDVPAQLCAQFMESTAAYQALVRGYGTHPEGPLEEHDGKYLLSGHVKKAAITALWAIMKPAQDAMATMTDAAFIQDYLQGPTPRYARTPGPKKGAAAAAAAAAATAATPVPVASS